MRKLSIDQIRSLLVIETTWFSPPVDLEYPLFRGHFEMLLNVSEDFLGSDLVNEIIPDRLRCSAASGEVCDVR